MYKDELLYHTTAEVMKMESVVIEDPQTINSLIALGFNYCIIRDKFYFLATPKLLHVMALKGM